MGFLERAIKKGISEGIGNAVGDAIQKAVEPKATELANKAANHIDQATQSVNQQAQQTVRQASGLESAFSNLQRSMEGYATEAAKNMKICPICNEACSADKAFCPHCGAKLPDTTVTEDAICSNCGKQNSVGMKFCSDCGAKLPAAIQEEQAKAAQDEAIMAEWDEKLPCYPKWNCGGCYFCLEEIDAGIFMFAPSFEGDHNAASAAVEKYRQLAMQSGFRQAGEYPNKYHLYNKINGVCYHIDTEHCFDGDPDCPCIYFDTREPSGGFDYVKPEPKKPMSLKDLFGF